jgi:hypothetical protein
MKYKVFVLFGKDKCQIFENDEVQKFSKIKDEINIYEFNTFEELEAFKNGVDEAVGIDEYKELSEDDISYIMEFSGGENGN